jgi:type IV secretory pathway VirB4 component
MISAKIDTFLNAKTVQRKTMHDLLCKKPDSIAKFFIYDEYLEEHKIFVHRDGSFGVTYRLSPREHETMTSEQIIEFVSSAQTLLTLEPGYTVQVRMAQTDLASLQNEREQGNPLSQMIFAERSEFLANQIGLFQRTLQISIRYFPPQEGITGTMQKLFATQAHDLKNIASHVGKYLRAFIGRLDMYELSSPFELERITAEELLSQLRAKMNPLSHATREFASHTPSAAIGEQIVYCKPQVRHGKVQFEDTTYKVLSLKNPPAYVFPGQMALLTTLDFPFEIVTNFNFPHASKTKRYLDMKEFFLQNTPSAKARRQREEVLEVQDRLARDDACLQMSFHIILSGKDEEVIAQRIRRLKSAFATSLDCELIEETDIGFGLFLQTLPMGYSPDVDLSARRFIRMLRSDAAQFLPLFDSFRGLKSTDQVYVSREKNVVPFGLLGNETSNHTVVVADSGSGKSAFIISCIQGLKRQDPEPLVFCLDKKSSYPMMSKFYGGELTVFEVGKEMPFSVFSGVFDEEKAIFLTRLICAAIKLVESDFKIKPEVHEAITRAFKLAHQKKQKLKNVVLLEGQLMESNTGEPAQINLEDFIIELSSLCAEKDYEKLKDEVDLVCQKLRPFYGDGVYAHFFKSQQKTSNPKTGLFVYDLDALDGDPVLRSLMSIAILEEIKRIKKLPENKNTPVVLVVEEMGRLGQIKEIADMLIDFAETGRKLGMWLIAISPRAKHFFEGEVGKAMWSVADNYLFLQMSSDNVNYLAENSAMIDEAGKQIIASLRLHKGSHAEVFYMNKKKTRQGAFCYHQTPLERWLAPTNVKDMAMALEVLKKFPGKPREAIAYLAKNYPNGVESEESAADKEGEENNDQ